jgi:hypothetical protein
VKLPLSVVALSVVTLVLAFGSTAQASVRKVALTSVVHAGDQASLTVAVSPRARCTITVVYETTVSHAQGLNPQTGTRITWRWKVGSNTHSGRWPITVKCGKSGTLKLKFHVIGK